MKYVFRYFFDPGSGICLWSANDAAREKYDYPVDHRTLGFDENLEKRVDYILAWFDTSLDWSYPPDPSPWSDEERNAFKAKTTELLLELRTKLGPEFEIRDERRSG